MVPNGVRGWTGNILSGGLVKFNAVTVGRELKTKAIRFRRERSLDLSQGGNVLEFTGGRKIRRADFQSTATGEGTEKSPKRRPDRGKGNLLSKNGRKKAPNAPEFKYDRGKPPVELL